MESKSQSMEKMIEAHCQRLVHDIVSFTILDLIACFIFFIMMRWIENIIEHRFLFLRALVLQFLLTYLLDKLCPEYITLILSYIYISVCKSIILPKSILKIDFSVVTRNRGKIVFGISACFVISASFLLEPYVLYCYLKNLAFFGFFVPHPDISTSYQYPVETRPKNGINCSRREDEIDIRDMKLTRDDLKTVRHILCKCSYDEIEEIGEHMMGYHEFSALFELEPSLDEVGEAFSIFDQDRDGFFDARDLQIVLIQLGLEAYTNLNTCQHMIEQYDSGGGGKIKSTDFCKLLEISLQ